MVIFNTAKGECLGFLIRVTWIQNGEFMAMNIFFELDWCDPTLKHKSDRQTCIKLKRFLDENGLTKFERQLKLCGDYAIAGTIKSHLLALGFEDLAKRITICNSHDTTNKYKRVKSRQDDVITHEDTEREF